MKAVGFKVLETFFSIEIGSQYSAGLSYNLRPGNDRLARLAEQWAEEGKVELIVPSQDKRAKVRGTGIVK